MKKYIASLLLGVLLLGCSPLAPKVEEKEPPSLSYEDKDFSQRYENTKPSEKALASLQEFSTKTFEELRKKENSFYSPLSLYLALSMLKDGAQGKSLEELHALMGEPLDSKLLMEHLALNTPAAQVLLANSLWVQKDFPLLQDYEDTLIKDHYAMAYNRDLHQEKTMKEISQWISDKTKGKIKPQLEMNPDAMLYLINTLYLKTAWKDTFQKEATQESIFHGIEDYKMDFMHQEASSMALENKQYKLALRSLQEGLEMYFVLPQENVDLKDLSYAEILSNLDKLHHARIKWSLPKVSLSTEKSLKETLMNLGVKEIFSHEANFENLSKEPLFVTLIKQFTDFSMDEEGVEAAAATIIGLEATSAPPEEAMEMNLNRPFGLIILHRGVPLFMGEIYNPQSIEG